MNIPWVPIVAGAAIVILVIWLISTYNRLVKSRNSSTEAVRGIDVALESRFDQIKAQADAVSGIVKKEVDMVLDATALRTGRTIEQLTMQEKMQVNAAMENAEQTLMNAAAQAGPGRLASIENYPEMQTHTNVELLQRTINEAEERLQAARRVYNRSATVYNTHRQTFPTVLIAAPMGFKHHELFELTDQRKKIGYNLEGYLD
ncbi:MAG: LemA family protein [Yaniella sp.]|uniref:LemA family protein n=1 Tax=Yaniella sp. TaxID=2773929 RepID=UPI0026482C39|nr:LemA family protein [Yaniella sp.]MDN5704577.1 LemA family protein [Yaniella sp.]MDN5731941.1 LemA family protein [Yaniella sp.]MDN5815236.1 LemA family protein [Yaniella sp.]MDN5818825.1 LemA family protein [Yaniella sp.]MDN5838343.1 LemA family protein [Yaniella sp.]